MRNLFLRTALTSVWNKPKETKTFKSLFFSRLLLYSEIALLEFGLVSLLVSHGILFCSEMMEPESSGTVYVASMSSPIRGRAWCKRRVRKGKILKQRTLPDLWILRWDKRTHTQTPRNCSHKSTLAERPSSLLDLEPWFSTMLYDYLHSNHGHTETE